MDIGRKLQSLERRLEAVERSPRLSHASIDGTSVQVRDSDGGLRGLVGMQADGTAAVNVVNGPPPPKPSAPVVAPVLGGVSAGWDGQFTDGAIIPMDWSRVEVHASTSAAYEPSTSTLQSTIETAQGATVVIPADNPVYVRLVARNTSGAASAPSDTIGPVSKAPVVANDILDGIVTEAKLAANAVTDAKIAVGAVKTVAIADGAVLDAKLADNAVKVGKIAAGAVTMNTLGGALGDTASQRYADYFRDATAWAQLSASGGTFTINTTPAGTPSGGGRLIVTGEVQVASKTLIPQDTDTLYRVMVRVRATAQDPSGPATAYIGVVGVAQDGVTLVSRTGTNSSAGQHYCCTSGGTIATADGWKTYVGWIQGHSAVGATPPAGPATDPRAPELTHSDVRFLRPMVWLNYGKSTTAVMEVEAVTVEAVRTGVVGSTNLISGSVTAGAIAADAVTAGKIAADAITARELAAGSVTASEVAAGAITTDKLTVTGGANILSDPSFEGAYSAALVANSAYWSIDSIGNGSAKSLKVNAAAAATTNRAQQLTTIPILPGDKLYLAYDYLTSSDYTPTAVIKLYARWEDAAGTILGYWSAEDSTPTLGGTVWTAVSETATAPAGTVQASIWAESFEATAGAVWFDNASVRPVLGGTQIQDGAITTQKVVAGAIQANQLAAGAVIADKIASAAVTTAKLDALAVTTDKLAANSITVDKLAAGSVNAAAIQAGAVKADKLEAVLELVTRLVAGDPAGARVELNEDGLRVYNSGGSLVIRFDAADGSAAFTGTITGSTITGSTFRTATSGERITINDGGYNTVSIVDATNRVVGEFSTRGLGLLGSSGATVWLDPDATYPNLRFSNASNSNWAYVQVSESSPENANLEMMGGAYTENGYTDMRSRLILGTNALTLDRLRAQETSYLPYGGRLYLDGTMFNAAFVNSDNTSQNTGLSVYANLVNVGNGRLQVQAPASSASAVYADAPTAHTGNLLRLVRDTDKFRVDKDGNVTFPGMLTAGNIASGSVNITPSAANTPTSAMVTFPALAGTTFRGFATAATTVPGVRAPLGLAGVTGVSTSSATSTSMLVHVNRENTTQTTVNWMVIGA